MGEFSLSPYQLPNYRSLHRFERWQISHQIVGNSFWRTPAQTHQGQNANSLPGKCGQSLKFSLWAKGPTGKYGGSRYCGWACPFDPGSYLDHYSSLPNPGHYYGKNFDLIQVFYLMQFILYFEKNKNSKKKFGRNPKCDRDRIKKEWKRIEKKLKKNQRKLKKNWNKSPKRNWIK